jgi:zinc transporter 2
MAAEFIGGYLAHSIAIWSDAFHLLSDVLAYVISLVAVLLSEKKSPAFLTFGWIKSQTLGALFNVAFIYIVTIELFIEATHRMMKKDKVEEPKYMLITSIFGLICNLFILNILHNDPNGGHHGCSHHHHADHLHS